MNKKENIEIKTETITQGPFRTFLKNIQIVKTVVENLNAQYERDRFVVSELQKENDQALLLDAGCGSQRYRKYCSNLKYKSQDFGEYIVDQRKSLGTSGVGGNQGYEYGPLDYKGDIWDIQESDEHFDVILCSEVFEHIPYPIETIKEFSRILKPGGKLILTAPNACLRHMDPYFYYSGFTDNWYEKILEENNFDIKLIDTVRDYYRYMAVEVARTIATHSILIKILLLPTFFYYYLKRKTDISKSTHCTGYHVVAIKNV